MKRFVFFLLIVAISSQVFPQDTKESKVLKEAFLDGEYFLAYEDYLDALPFYQQVYETDKDNANINYKIGLCYLNITGQKKKAIDYLEKAVLNTTGNYREGDYKEVRAPNDAYFFLGIAYQIQEQFEKAESNLQTYLDLLDPSDTLNIQFVEQQIAACKVAPDFIRNRIYFDAENLGDKVNTNSDDYYAVVSGDGNTMVYISSLKFYDALFYTSKINGEWDTPVNITPDIKSDGDYYPTGLSFNGDQLLLNRSDGFNSDIYSSTLVNSKWKPAQKIRKGELNSKFWESHAALTEDGKSLYFTSNRGGGYGGLDIYKARLDENTGLWSNVENLGPVINSPFNEETPFICKDGKTLFFASQGHTNMGGFDIFSSVQREDGTWTVPQNIGYPLNSTDDDIFFIPGNKGTKGYMSFSNMDGGSGKKDIYYLNIFSDRNPRIVEIKGSVTLAGDPEAGPDKVRISIKSAGPGFSEEIRTESPKGNFTTLTRVTGTYILKVESEGYITQTKTVSIPGNYSMAELVADFELQPAPVTTDQIVLKNIYFEHHSTKISDTGMANITEVVAALNEHSDLRILLAGYCDNTGTEAYNKSFSLKRSQAVGAVLARKGISKDRFEIKGFGETSFLAVNKHADGTDAPEGRKFNRRVEFHIISSKDNIVSEVAVVPSSLKYNK